MPDLRCALQYNRAMLALEQRHSKALGRIWDELRDPMLDDLLDKGLAWTGLVARYQERIRKSDKKIVDANRRYLQEAAELAGRLAACQGVEEQTAAQAAGQVAQAVASGAASTAWQMQTQARFTADVMRLQLGGESTGEAAAALFARGIDATGRASTFRKAEQDLLLAGHGALWGLAGAALAALYLVHNARYDGRFQKQAIAAIDERTTNCCLRVHGQVQPMDKPFRIEGTPRYSDRQQNPPFHWYCRTAVTLYSAEMEETGLTTAEMQAAARAELAAREDGSRVEIHPASATSRR